MVVKGTIIKFFQRVVSAVRNNAEPTTFFFFLTTSLFFGDGKQPFVDAWWALGILTMYGVRYYQRGKLDLRPLPRPISLAWTALILYYIIRTPFSDSVGYSITATIRLTEAYLVYLLFYTISSERLITLFIKGLIAVGTIATLASFVFFLVPSWAGFLPPMNLLYATYGHNHLADLLLFVFPVSVELVEKKRSAGAIGLLVLFVIGMLLTFARGAWILFVFYLLFLVVRSKHLVMRRIGLSVAAAIVVVFLTLSLVSLRGMSQNDGFVGRVTRQLQKQSFPEDGRWEYWRQALVAMGERPWFGSGPGTFYLQSKRLQVRPSFYSWFAHSFPLQTLVELGIVGTIPLFLLLFLILRSIRNKTLIQQHSIDYLGFQAGLGLALVYSFFEFNLDYVVVWLLFWMTFGVIVGVNSKTLQRVTKRQHVIVWVYLVSLGVFYITYTGSSVLSFVKTSLVVYIAPYRIDLIRQYLDEKNVGSVGMPLKLFNYFHKRDPEVVFPIAQAADGQGDSVAIFYYENATRLDPHNEMYFRKYFFYLAKKGAMDQIGAIVKQWGNKYLIGSVRDEAGRVDFSSPELAEAYASIFSEDSFERPKTSEALSKLYYLLGLKELSKDPQKTQDLWTLARDSAPEWGYYHAELASLLLYEFADESAAKEVLVDCTQYRYPKELCTIALQHWDEVPKPGSYEQQIRKIPKIDE